MSAAVLAEGRTIVTGAAREPEIVDLGAFLNVLGARIAGLGTSTLEIEGVPRLGGGYYRVIADRIEAGTLLVAAALTRGRVRVEQVDANHLTAVLAALADAGCQIALASDAIELAATARPGPLCLTALPYPGIPTDLQSQFVALAALANGASMVRDGVFPERFMQVAELNRLGASIQRQADTAIVRGVPRLTGATVMASDLRASAALVLAGLVAEGETIVRRVYHLDRGYERLDAKLAQLGARIERHPDTAATTPPGKRAAPAAGNRWGAAPFQVVARRP
jgi:UDP-N-acetylglucosamine 1-carboxyvinyltransferase